MGEKLVWADLVKENIELDLNQVEEKEEERFLLVVRSVETLNERGEGGLLMCLGAAKAPSSSLFF